MFHAKVMMKRGRKKKICKFRHELGEWGANGRVRHGSMNVLGTERKGAL